MDKTKKRHNPPIFDEDHSVKAFDRNNDSVSLDNLVKNADPSKVEVVISDDALKRSGVELINKVFGEDLKYYKKTETTLAGGKGAAFSVTAIKSELVDFKDEFLRNLDESKLVMLKEKRNKWYQKKKLENYVTLEVDLLARKVIDEYGEVAVQPRFFENGKYNPIKITAHTQEALQQAKIFAAAYQNLTGQKARVIQDCIQEVKLEQKVEEKTPSRLSDMGEEFFKDLDKLKGTFPVFKGIGKGLYTGALMPFFGYTSMKRMAKTFETTDLNEGATHFTTGLVTGICGTLGAIAWSAHQASDKGNYDPLLIITATQSANFVCLYLKSLWNRSKR